MERVNMDKDHALTIVIEKLTEIVGNINQDAKSVTNQNSRPSPQYIIKQTKGTSNASADDAIYSHLDSNSGNTGQKMEIATESSSSPNQVVINLPVKVGNLSITNTEGLLQSLKKLNNKSDSANKKVESRNEFDLYACSKCEYSSHNKHYLKQHVDLVHTEERPFKCPLCDYAGKRSHSLKEHLVVHSPYRPFMCPFCSASFRKKGHLTNHVKLHASEQAMACAICKHFIANRSELSKHLRQTHADEDVFLCPACEYACCAESDIIMHMHTHGNPSVYKCSECEFVGVHDRIVYKHIQMEHGGKGEITVTSANGTMKSGPVIFLKCSECGYTTNNRESMKDHMYKNHLTKIKQEHGANDAESMESNEKCQSGSELWNVSDIPEAPLPQTKLIFACSLCSFNCNDRQDIVEHIIKTHNGQSSGHGKGEEGRPGGSGQSSGHRKGEEGRPGGSGQSSVDRKEEEGKPGGTFLEESDTERNVVHSCSVCGFESYSALVFDSHMQKHGKTSHETQSPTREENSDNDSGKLGFIQLKKSGQYYCLICGYTCTHQRTIKAHIWRHSGHKDVDYPIFKQQQITTEEATDRQSGSDAGPSTTCDSTLNTVEKVITIASHINAGQKRKNSDLKPSEMDMSMPKMRIVTSGSPVFIDHVHGIQAYSDEDKTEVMTPEHPTNTSDTLNVVAADDDSECFLEEVGDDKPVVMEQVIESEDVYEVVVETSESSSVDSQKPVSLRELLQKKHPGQINKEVIVKSQKQGSGISSSLLAVIEQFRNDSEADSADGRDETIDSNYELVQDSYRCCVCHYTSRFIAGMKSHMRTHKARQEKECSLCGFVAASAETLQDHMLKHCVLNQKPSHSCNFCPETFYYKYQYLAHKKLHENADNFQQETQGNSKPGQADLSCYVCENCEKTFDSVTMLLNHKSLMACWTTLSDAESSKGEKKGGQCFKCNFCDFVGMSLRSVKSHMKRHWNDLRAKHSGAKLVDESKDDSVKKYFACERCAKVFSNIIDFLSHNSLSCSSQPSKCNECNFASQNPDLFEKHMKYHNDHGKIYKCEVCDFVSKSYSRMDNHVKKHMEPCDLHCTHCEFIASSVRSLKSHMKRHTNDERFVRQPLEQYKCNMCGYICHHLPALKSHMWRHASDTTYSYEKTNAVINAALEDVVTENSESEPTPAEGETNQDAVKEAGSTAVTEESIIAFRCCHCFYETSIKKELNDHMQLHLEIIKKTIEVNNGLFMQTPSPKVTSERAENDEDID